MRSGVAAASFCGMAREAFHLATLDPYVGNDLLVSTSDTRVSPWFGAVGPMTPARQMVETDACLWCAGL